MRADGIHRWLFVASFAGAFCAARANAVRLPRIELLRDVRAPATTAGLLESTAAAGRLAAPRDLRPLAVEEVIAAIERALAQQSPPVIENLSAKNVLLESQIQVGKGDPDLQVLRAEFDAGIKRARFLLRAAGDRNALPFYVTLSPSEVLPPSSYFGRGGALGSPTALAAIGSEAKKATPAVLVSPEQSATLALQSNLVGMTAEVVPLERGIMGQWVRVRVMDTGKILRARVDGRAHLEAQF